MENDWWLKKAEDMQKQADENNFAGFFRSLREVYGPQPKISNALLSRDGTTTITEPRQIIERWGEYFGELLNVEAKTDETILNLMPSFPQMYELNATPSLEEVTEATNKMKIGKTPGKNGIPAEVYKHGGEQLIKRLHQLIRLCWQEGTIPQDFKNVTIIPIFKNKGDYRYFSNYKRISLLSIAGKIMVKIIQRRLARFPEEVLTESQCGFRQEQSTIDI